MFGYQGSGENTRDRLCFDCVVHCAGCSVSMTDSCDRAINWNVLTKTGEEDFGICLFELNMLVSLTFAWHTVKFQWF